MNLPAILSEFNLLVTKSPKTFRETLKSTKTEVPFPQDNIFLIFKSWAYISKEYIHMPVVYSFLYTELGIASWTYAHISIFNLTDICIYITSNIDNLYIVYLYHHSIGISKFYTSSTLINTLLNVGKTILKGQRSG